MNRVCKRVNKIDHILLQATGQLSVSFRNMSLKKIKRAEKKGTESVMDEKFALLFWSEFSIGSGEFSYQVRFLLQYVR